MKIKTVLLVGFAASQIANASIGLEMYVGVATDSSGVPVPDGTLWALVVDDGDSSFPGGFGLNAGLGAAGASNSFSKGQQFELGGSFGADKVFAIGGFNGKAKSGLEGYHSDLLNFDLTTSLAAGKNTAVYFFPGAIYDAGTAKQTIASQVGGLNAPVDTPGNMEGMIVPGESFTIKYGGLSSAAGGSVPSERFRAVDLVPEPSSALLGLFGILAFLRRKRH